MTIPQNPEVDFIFDQKIGGSRPFFLIAGPCVIESYELLQQTAAHLKAECEQRGIFLVFKSSFDKANRSSASSFRGPGIEEGLKMLAQVKKEFNLPILTDIHHPEEAEQAARVADILQIPAFLSRQTDLVIAAANTSAWVNVKKGQFMAPLDALKIIEKVKRAGSERVSITERGYTFGYNNLVVDMRAFEILRREGVHVIFDATHSTQLPGGGEVSGGEREMAYPLARAAAAVGVDGFFIETHPEPAKAKSDATNQMPLKEIGNLLDTLQKLDKLVKHE